MGRVNDGNYFVDSFDWDFVQGNHMGMGMSTYIVLKSAGIFISLLTLCIALIIALVER